MNQNATNQQIRDLLDQGLTNTAVSRQLHCCRARVRALRKLYDIPLQPVPRLTLQQAWKANTRRVKGGHVRWTGSTQSTSGTPVMRYQGKTYTAAAIAFRIRTGRDPQGYTFAKCGYPHCVAQTHVDDAVGRMQARENLRHLTGYPERPKECVHGHDQAKHGRYEADGRSYCAACKRLRRPAPAAASV